MLHYDELARARSVIDADIRQLTHFAQSGTEEIDLTRLYQSLKGYTALLGYDFEVPESTVMTKSQKPGEGQ